MDKVDSEQGKQSSSYYFDFAQQISQEHIGALDITHFGIDNGSSGENARFASPKLASVLELLKAKLANAKFNLESASDDGNKNVLRVLIQSLGSPLWWSENFSSDLCLFLLLLRSIVKYSATVCCVTVPSHLFQHFVRC